MPFHSNRNGCLSLLCARLAETMRWFVTTKLQPSGGVPSL